MNLDNLDEPAREIVEKMLELKKRQKQEIQQKYDSGEIIDYKNKNYGNCNGKSNKNQQKQNKELENKNNEKKQKHKITTFKYSQLGRGDLYESIFIDNQLPVFIKFNKETNSFEAIEQIEETTRILVPPTIEECPYLPYEFESLDEINSINKLIEHNHIDLDYLYYNGYEIVSKYNNQSKHKLRLLTIKIITSHFQDRFPTTEYLYPVGGNGSGKSSIAETFRAIAYRAVVMTDPSGPNIFRLLGIVEPVQCTMVLEEADKIHKSPELMAILKTGYSYYGSVSKINPYTLRPEFFFTYCAKIIVSERSLNQSIAKGVTSRTFPINCIKGKTKHDIKEILNPTNKDGTQNKNLLQEIINFRKLLLVYRLKHFKDSIPDLDIGVHGRDKELVKHSIQLFYGSKCLKEVTETLQEFLDLKNDKKNSSIEFILLSIVATLVKYEGPEVSSQKIWNTLMEEIPGMLNEKNPNEYHTNDYGTIYRTSTLPSYLGDSFGGVVKHRKNGNVWIFNRETIESLAKEDTSRITITTTSTEVKEEKGEGVKAVNTPEEGGSINLQKNNEKTIIEESTENQERENLIINDNDDNNKIDSAKHIENNDKNIEKSDKPLLQMPSLPSPIHQSWVEKKVIEEFNNHLISEADLSIGGPYNPKIINNIDRIGGTDRWFCNNCTMKDDKWGMMKHPCTNNKKKGERTGN